MPPTPISERQHIFLGTRRAWDHFRREHREAEFFKHVTHESHLRGREIGYVIVADEPLSQWGEMMLRECQMGHPECVIYPYDRNIFVNNYLSPGHLNGLVACMWCGDEYRKSAIEAHEEVCGG